MGLFFLRESYGPKILLDRAVRLRKETGDDSYQTEAERQNKTLPEVLRSSLVRPFRLLLTQPIVQVLALFMAYIYGIMYLVLSTFPTLWTSPSYYNESTGIGGLNYISLGLGFWLGSQICAPLNDRIYRRLKARNADVGKPEFRVPLLFVGASLSPLDFSSTAGLLSTAAIGSRRTSVLYCLVLAILLRSSVSRLIWLIPIHGLQLVRLLLGHFCAR